MECTISTHVIKFIQAYLKTSLKRGRRTRDKMQRLDECLVHADVVTLRMAAKIIGACM